MVCGQSHYLIGASAPTQTGGFRTKSGHVALVCGLVVAVLLLQIGFGGFPASVVFEARAAPPASLTVGFLQSIDSLNPYIGINDPSYLLYGLIYDYPFAFDQDGNTIPNLVTSANCANANCSIWNYAVRQGVYWSDGTLMTPQDVAFSWNYTSQNLFHLWAFEPYMNQVVQCKPATRGVCGAQIHAAVPWNVTLYFQRPYVSGRDLYAPIVQEAQWSGVSPQAAETSYSNANPIGTGPFIADANIYNEWLQNGAVPYHLFRNTRYHPVGNHTGPSNISDIYLRVYDDPNALVLALENGDIQLAQLTTAGIAAVQGFPGIQTVQALQAIQEWNEIGISQIDTSAANGRLNPIRFDTRVRQAMAMATNKDRIMQNFYSGAGVRGDSLISPITPQWWYDPVAGGDNLTFNIQAANALLNQSGYTTWSGGSFGNGYRQATNNIVVSYQTACYQCVSPPNVTKTIPSGTRIAFTMATRPQNENPEEVQTANFLVEQYALIGIQITLKIETTEEALSTDIYNGFTETYIWYWSSDHDPNYMLSMETSWTLDGWNDNYWNNGTYNAYFLKQMGDENLATRQADVRAAEKIFYESAVYIIYIYPYGNWAWRTDTVTDGQQWTGWGDWINHPYRQMNAFWGANPLWFDLKCPVCTTQQLNQPPTQPVVTGSKYVSVRTNTSLGFSATSSDPETTDTLNWTWHWGDGNTTLTTGSAATATSSASHSWYFPGNYTVYVDVADGHNPAVASADVFVNVTTPPANPGSIQGTVRDTGGTPLTNFQVIANPGSFAGTNAAGGTYAITNLAAGTYSVTVAAPGYVSHTQTGVVVTAGAATTVDFSVEASLGWIAGTVTDSATSAPIQGAVILVTGATGANTGQEKTVSTDASGKYNLSREPGTFWVNVSLAGYASQSRSGISVTTGNTTSLSFQLASTSGPAGPTALDPLIVGAVALVVIIAVAALVTILFLRRRKKKETEEAKIQLPPKSP